MRADSLLAQAAVDRELAGGTGPRLRALGPEARLVGLVRGAGAWTCSDPIALISLNSRA